MSTYYASNRENDITDVIFETFSTTEEQFGETVTTELKPGGRNITVTEENKKAYVAFVVLFLLHLRSSDLLSGQHSCRIRDLKTSS